MSNEPRAAVVGAGRMGIGISVALAQAGLPVALLDIKERPQSEAAARLDAARAEIVGTFAALADAGLLAGEEARRLAALVRFAAGAKANAELAQAGIVFEGVPEVLEIKEAALARISVHAPSAIVASTTSTFLSNELARFVTAPERFLNTHWLNPAYLIPLVELSPAEQTSAAAVDTTRAFLRRIGKISVVCAARPGFIVPRIQALAMNEAARIVEEGVASAEDVDIACRIGFGLRFAILGLVEFIDYGGIDILHHASDYLCSALPSERHTAPAIVGKLMEAGHDGIRTGRGFHDWSGTDVEAYRRETVRKLAALLAHFDLLPPYPGHG